MKFLISQITYFLSERDVRKNLRGFLNYLWILLLTIALFSVLFHYVMLYFEGQSHSWITGFYWTLTVMTTLGFGDITFHSDIGRLYSIVVLISGVFLLLVMLPFTFIRFFYAPWLETQLRLRAPREVPQDTRDHVVICGWDSLAPGLIERLKINQIPYWLIEPDQEAAAHLHGDGLSVVTGEVDGKATYENVNVNAARLVFANLDDTSNTNIVVTVREIAPEVTIVALVEGEDSVDVLELSGADYVLPLKQKLGEHLSIRVNAGKTLTHVIGTLYDHLVAEFPVQKTDFAGKTVAEVRLRERTGVSIIGIWERGVMLPVQPSTLLRDNSVPVVIGTREQIDRLEQLFRHQERSHGPVLIIGGGKVGRAAARALKQRGVVVHLVEKKNELAAKIERIVDRLIIGDAVDREVLVQAGFEEAPSVLLTTHDDGVNIFLTVYCRKLRPGVHIISRCTHARNIEALNRAGADYVLSYAGLGVETVFSLIQRRPPVILGAGVDFFLVSLPASLAGKTLAESEIGSRTGLNVIGIEEGNSVLANPPASKRLAPGSRLLLMGTTPQRQLFHEVFGGGS